MDILEIKNKSKKDLQEMLRDTQDKLRELRFQTNEAQLKNVRSIRKVRKDIAQILTLIRLHLKVAPDKLSV